MHGRRILFLNNQGLDQSGGGVTILRHLVRRFAVGNEVTVLAETRAAEGFGGLDQRILPPLGAARPGLWRLDPLRRARAWGREVLELAPRLDPARDLVIALDCHFAGAVARLPAAARVYLSLAAIPRMEWFLGGKGGRSWRFGCYFLLERRMIGLADLTLVSSELHASEIRRWELLPRFDPLVLHPVLPLPERSSGADPPALARHPGEVVVLSVARLEPLKGLGVVPALAARLRDLPCRFVLLGEGPERGRIEARARELGVTDRVELRGDVLDPGPFYRAADLFLHPSRYESFGLAVLEAMQHGLPVVCGRRTASTVVAISELLEDGRHGRLVDLDDEAALAGVLRELAGDGERRRRLGRAAAERAAELLAEDYPARVEEALDALLERKGGAR